MGDVQQWTLVVAKIADKNDGKNCGPTGCRWAFKIQEHNGDVDAAIASENGVLLAPPPAATRERMFNMFTGKTAGFPVAHSIDAGAKDDSSSEEPWEQLLAGAGVQPKPGAGAIDEVFSEDESVQLEENTAAVVCGSAIPTSAAEVAVLSSSPSAAEEKTLLVVVVPVPPLSSADAAGQGLHLPSVGGREGESVDGGDGSATASVGAVLSAVTIASSAASGIAPALAVAGAKRIGAVPVSPPPSPSRLSDPAKAMGATSDSPSGTLFADGDGGGGIGSSDGGDNGGGEAYADAGATAEASAITKDVGAGAGDAGASPSKLSLPTTAAGAEVAVARTSQEAVLSSPVPVSPPPSPSPSPLPLAFGSGAGALMGGGLPPSPSPSHPQSTASAGAAVPVSTSPSYSFMPAASGAVGQGLHLPSLGDGGGGTSSGNGDDNGGEGADADAVRAPVVSGGAAEAEMESVADVVDENTAGTSTGAAPAPLSGMPSPLTSTQDAQPVGAAGARTSAPLTSDSASLRVRELQNQCVALQLNQLARVVGLQCLQGPGSTVSAPTPAPVFSGGAAEAEADSLVDAKLVADANTATEEAPLLSSDAVLLKDCMEDKCPRCRSAYIFDPDGGECFAIKCNDACKAAFCAWCLADCGEDAHEHVANCSSNQEPRPQRGSSSRPVHSSLELLQQWRLKRRQAQVTTMLKRMARDKAALVLGEEGVAQTLRDYGLGDIVLQFASVPASSPGGAVTMTSTAASAYSVTGVIDVSSESDSDTGIRFGKPASGNSRRVVSESDSGDAETDVAASGAAGNKQKCRAGKRWWADVDDNDADGITEAQFADNAKTVATVSELDPRFAATLSVRTSTLGLEAGRGLFFNVAEASRLGLTFPLFLPLCGIARKARGITAAEKKNGCLLDTGLCVQNEQVRQFVSGSKQQQSDSSPCICAGCITYRHVAF